MLFLGYAMVTEKNVDHTNAVYKNRAAQEGHKLAKSVEQVRDDVRRFVEVMEVREDTGNVAFLHAHPSRNGHHHTFPRILGDEASTSKVSGTACNDGIWVFVYHSSAIPAPADDEMLASPSVVTSSAVGIKGPRELGLAEHDHIIPDALSLHLVHERIDSSVHFVEFVGKVLLHHAVVVPSADVNIKYIALGASAFTSCDQRRRLMELSLQVGARREIRLQLHRGHDFCQILGRIDRLEQSLRICVGVHVAVRLNSDVFKDVLPVGKIAEIGGTVPFNQLGFCHDAAWPGCCTRQREGRSSERFVRAIRKRAGDCISEAPSGAPSGGSDFLALQSMRRIRLV